MGLLTRACSADIRVPEGLEPTDARHARPGSPLGGAQGERGGYHGFGALGALRPVSALPRPFGSAGEGPSAAAGGDGPPPAVTDKHT
jgi:hypothetical protein